MQVHYPGVPPQHLVRDRVTLSRHSQNRLVPRVHPQNRSRVLASAVEYARTVGSARRRSGETLFGRFRFVSTDRSSVD